MDEDGLEIIPLEKEQIELSVQDTIDNNIPESTEEEILCDVKNYKIYVENDIITFENKLSDKPVSIYNRALAQLLEYEPNKPIIAIHSIVLFSHRLL